jgi:hypothetical protein
MMLKIIINISMNHDQIKILLGFIDALMKVMP